MFCFATALTAGIDDSAGQVERFVCPSNCHPDSMSAQEVRDCRMDRTQRQLNGGFAYGISISDQSSLVFRLICVGICETRLYSETLL